MKIFSQYSAAHIKLQDMIGEQLHVEQIRQYIELEKIDVNMCDSHGWSLKSFSLSFNHIPLSITFLILFITIIRNAVHQAARMGSLDTLLLLLNYFKADPSISTSKKCR